MPKILEDSFISGVDQFWVEETQAIRLPAESKLHALVEDVGNHLTRENGMRRLTYHVCESKEVNAFVTPGGHVYVHTGLLNVLETKDELAIVLGHELSHKIASRVFLSLLSFPPQLMVSPHTHLQNTASTTS